MIALDPAGNKQLVCNACETHFDFPEYDDRHEHGSGTFHADCCVRVHCNDQVEAFICRQVRRIQANDRRKAQDRRKAYEQARENDRRKADRRNPQ